jgi:hypothetical protein
VPVPLPLNLPAPVGLIFRRLEAILSLVLTPSQPIAYVTHRVMEGDQLLVPETAYRSVLPENTTEDSLDLVMADAVRNPYVRRDIEASKQLIDEA